MGGDGSFVIWLVLAAIPLGLVLISLWARARPPGEAREKGLEQEPQQPRDD